MTDQPSHTWDALVCVDTLHGILSKLIKRLSVTRSLTQINRAGCTVGGHSVEVTHPPLTTEAAGSEETGSTVLSQESVHFRLLGP